MTACSIEFDARLGYHKLEPRQVLSASFAFGAGLLTLDGFDAGEDLSFSQATVDIGASTDVDAYIFEIDSGSWTDLGPPNAGIELESPTRLEVTASLLTNGLVIDGANNIGITQGSSFTISDFSISNFTLVDQTFDLDIDGEVTLNGITVSDSNPGDAIDPDIMVQATGAINVHGLVSNLSTDVDSFLLLSATGTNSDIIVDGAAIQTAAGDVSLLAADEISILNNSTIVSGLDGSVTLTANSDDAAGDVDGIMISDGSSIDGTTGAVNLTAAGIDGGDITLGNITTTGSVTLNATGEIIDGTADEIANIIGERTDLTGAGIGSADDIDIQVANLSFNSDGSVQISDLADGVTVDAASSAQTGSLTASSPLTISANVNLAGSFAFVAGDSVMVGDNITINNNAIVDLTAATNETVDFITGDDLIFETGRVVTGGGGVHEVHLTADNEGGLDADRGTITNSPGAIASVTTNALTISAAAGVGSLGNALRTNVDGISATNSLVNGIYVREEDGITIAGITTANGDAKLTVVANNLDIDEDINLGTGNLFLDVAGNVTQQAGDTIAAGGLALMVDGTTVLNEAGNNVTNIAANNGGTTLYRDADTLNVESVAVDGMLVTGITTTNDDVKLIVGNAAGENLAINQAINLGTGDLFLDVAGNVTQTAPGTIVAGGLALMVDGTTHLQLGNDVDTLAAQTGDTVVYNDLDGLTIGTVTVLDGTIDQMQIIGITTTFTGVTSQGAGDVDDGDVLINADGFLLINEQIDAGIGGTADVRLTADGDIHQLATAGIIADELGVRQQSNALVVGNDIDANGRYDVLLDGVNDAHVLAGLNAFDGGVFTFNEIDDLTIDAVSAQNIVGVTFATTTGLTTTFSGAAASGAGDVDDGDIIVNTDGFLEITQPIIAGGGLADVRLSAGGDVTQDALGVIFANELGVNQQSNVFNAVNDLDGNNFYDIHLCAVNVVDVFGAENAFAGGGVRFDNFHGYTVGEITPQTIDDITFAGANGVQTNDGDVFLNSPGFLNIEAPIDAGAGTVRLVGNGDIHQLSTAGIIAAQLGVRQQGTLLNATDDLDANARYDVILDGNNDVNVLAGFNVFDGGVFAFNDIDDLTIGMVASLDTGTKIFATTFGVETNFSGAVATGAGDVDDGDIIVEAAGFLQIDLPIIAGGGNADVRLTADGDIHQETIGVILANELGVRQIGNVLVAANDLDANGFYDIKLCFDNNVDIFAANSDFVGGSVEFNNSVELIIGEVTPQTIDGVSFDTTTGISTVDGDVFVRANGYLSIDEPINAGGGTVRLIANGDIHQTADGIITADRLGVRQEATVYVAGQDLDANGRYDIILDDGNDVDFLAAYNLFETGVFVFNDVDDLTIDEVAALTSGNKSFALTTGITTTFTGLTSQGAGDAESGDVLINADGFLLINEQIAAGGGATADVRLVADGDLHQIATGIILADELGARQESNTFSAANDIDSNGVYDVILCFDNQVSFFAAENQFDGGGISFSSVVAFDIAEVFAQTIGNVTFDTTTGVVSDGSQFLQSSAGAINITTTIDAGAGTVYLVANGDIFQSAGNIIIAAGLGVRQEATVYNAVEDLDANGLFDIILTEDNEVDNFAADNAFADGAVAFRSVNNLTIFSIPETDFCDFTFLETDGVSAAGDILIETEGYLYITAPINADDGADDVRLIANGDIIQNADGIITANFLGVRQERLVFDPTYDFDANGRYDVLLCEDNLVNDFAAFNPVGDVYYQNAQNLVIGEVATQMIGNIAFTTTTGIIAGNDAVVQVDGNLQVGEAIMAGDEVLLDANGYISLDAPIAAVEVRLVSDGDIAQSAAGTITADILGVRQEAAVFNAAGDLDANGFFEIILDDGNDVNVVAALNDYEDGVIVFNDIDNLEIGRVDAVMMACGETFDETVGIIGRGDILVEVDSYLSITEEINADNGNDDVRLIANGDIIQNAAGIIIADDLGVRQERLVYNATHDFDGNGFYDIILCENNRVNNFAAFNPVGDVLFYNVQSYSVGEVTTQTIGNITFAATNGVVAGDEIFLGSGGGLVIADAVDASEVRIVANGDILNSGSGSIVANILGVRQESTFADIDIVLDGPNNVDILAGFNASERGVFVFNDVDDLTIDTVSESLFCDKTFAETVGITTTFTGPGMLGAADADSGDILINADGFLRINQLVLAGVDCINANNRGNADVRLIADADVTQAPNGIIVAQELGVRQQGMGNNINIILDQANDVGILSANNISDGGFIVFNDTDESPTNNLGLTIDDVSDQTIGNVTFATTNGVMTTYSGVPVVGVDVDLGDILVNSDGFLQVNEQINAGDGKADIRITANGDIHQSTIGEITANELGVRQRGSIVDPAYDIGSNARYDILLGESNDVDNLAMANLDRNGELRFHDINDLRIDQVNSQVIGGGNVTFDTVLGVTSDDGNTALPTDGVGNITLEAEETLNDGNNIPIITGGNGFFRGGVEIELADQAGDRLWIGSNASFQSPDIEVGQDSFPAGNANVLFGSLAVNDLDPNTQTGTADITEDDSTLLIGENSTGTLVLTSAEDITNDIGAEIKLNQVQFNAGNGTVFIGNRTGDSFGSGVETQEIEIGVVAQDVSIAADSAVEVNGNVPANPDLNRPHSIDPDPFALGTRVTSTLFVTSFTDGGNGHIEQTVGDLYATSIGLAADNHVHLESVSAFNQVLAVSAGDSDAANLASHQVTLDALAAITGSEVRPDPEQSVSIVHQGAMTVALVVNPDLVGDDLSEVSEAGIITDAAQDGSVFLMAKDMIAINEDVSATSNGSLPQVTAYVQDAVANDASRIIFNDNAAIRVSGIDGMEENNGVVKFAQTEAVFGVDSDGDGDIDSYFYDANGNGVFDAGDLDFDTTAIIRLEGASSTAEQLVESLYGHPGEEGYRFAYVWDSQRRFDVGLVIVQEDPNLYTITNELTESERYDVLIMDQDAPGTDVVSEAEFTFQTDLIEQVVPFGPDFNFDTVFVKIDPWTRDALTLRTDDPLVYTTVEVRNDQDINLFVGALGAADNSLNAVTNVLEARIETPGHVVPSVPFVFEPNPILIVPTPNPIPEPIDFVQTFDQPEPPRPDAPGTLSWIAVEIGDPDDEEDLPRDNILEVDGELILKNPDAEYQPLNEGEQPTEIEADKNEIEKIIAEIEADDNAEAGLWYKIFVDYEEGSGKKDELLFYYFKTGKQQTDDLGPESDFKQKTNDNNNGIPEEPGQNEDDNQPKLDGPKRDGPTDNEGAIIQPLTNYRVATTDSTSNPELHTDQELAGSEKLGLSSGTILLATLASRKRREEQRIVVSELGLPAEEVNFSRFDRLKRRVVTMLGRTD